MNAKELFSLEGSIGVVYRSSTPNGLQFVRSLGQAGVPVLALGDGNRTMGMRSRYAYPMHCPDGIKEADAFINFLLDIGKQLSRKAVLFLMNDPHLIVVAHHREVLDQYYEIPIPAWEALEQCLDKARMYEIADLAGIPIPRTYAPASRAEIQEISRAIPYPCILKPVSQYEFSDGRLRKSAFHRVYGAKALRANSADELVELFGKTMADGFRIVVQEEIPGPEDVLYTVGLYADKASRVMSTFTGRKLHQLPPDFGLCTYGESLSQQGIVELASRLVKAVGFHGIAQVEFKLDLRDDQFKLMEINPRGWQWSYLATACGINLPYMAYCDLNGLALASVQQATTRRTWTHMADDYQRFLQFGWKGKLGKKITFWEWLSWAWTTLIRADNHDAVLSWQDPVPGLIMILHGIMIRMRGGFRSLFESRAKGQV
jgi:D-aspartate ligase